MPIDESGNLLDQTPNGSFSVDVDAHAPPLYGEHILDQLYADIDPSGFRTPAPQSGMSTPYGNQSRSRSGSNENMPSMDGIAGTEVRPDALSSRLQNLDVGLSSSSRNSSSLFRRGNASGSGGNTPLRHGYGSTGSMQNSVPRSFDHFPDESSLPRSNPLSRRTSEDENIDGQGSGRTTGRHTPEHIDYSEIDLSKVPSYTTAIRAPARGMSYTEAEALPNYETAISAPPSPQGGYTTLATVAETPTTEVNENSTSNVSGGRPRNPLAGMGLTLHRGHSMDADASRRLHLLQARARVH
jgi:arrestin-related trafficking adapter 4/5/7